MTENAKKNKYAKVVLTILSPRMSDFYTYCVPEWMSARIRVGSLVLVPVRNILKRGVVIELADDTSPCAYEIKNIVSLYGPERILDEKGIEFARWIANYYHSTLFAAVKLLFWDLKNFKIKTEYEVDNPDNLLRFLQEKLGLFGKLKKPIKIGTVLSGQKIKAILKACGAYGTELTNLEEEILKSGIVRPVYCLAKGRLKSSGRVYSIADPPPVDSEPTPKEEEMLLCIADHGHPASWDDVRDDFPNGLRHFNSLLKKGLLVEIFTGESHEELRSDSIHMNLTKEQIAAVSQIADSIKDNSSDTFLIEGITGSGKTEIYVECTEKALKKGSVIVLVPEIVLTLQIVERFKDRFGENLFVLHSNLGEARLKRSWEMLRGSEKRIVIGPRSALFAPLSDVKLIIIDEEHEPAYKQERSPRYHARDAARKLASLRQATLVLGSATPSLESRYLADREIYHHIYLSRRIHKGGLPEVNVLKLEPGNPQNPKFMSASLVNEIRKTLERGKQILLFINQRGFSNSLVCHACGHSPRCPNCDISLTFHARGNMLLCHHCGHQKPAFWTCPMCGSKTLWKLGFGTQRVEEETTGYFPNAKVYRLDSDVASRGGIEGGGLALMKRFFDERGDILIGTQMIGKGLDLPDVELVGIISADTSLTLPDFRAAERTFQIITQVAGRAGRRERKGYVILQSYALGHYAIESARMQDYRSFYEREIEVRKKLGYPPFTSLARIIFKGENPVNVQKQSLHASEILRDLSQRKAAKILSILGPSPAPLGKVAGKYRFHLIIKAKKVSDLIDTVTRLENRMKIQKGVWMDVDINPINMM